MGQNKSVRHFNLEWKFYIDRNIFGYIAKMETKSSSFVSTIEARFEDINLLLYLNYL